MINHGAPEYGAIRMEKKGFSAGRNRRNHLI